MPGRPQDLELLQDLTALRRGSFLVTDPPSSLLLLLLELLCRCTHCLRRWVATICLQNHAGDVFASYPLMPGWWVPQCIAHGTIRIVHFGGSVRHMEQNSENRGDDQKRCGLSCKGDYIK